MKCEQNNLVRFFFFFPTVQDAGVEMVVVDNDRQAHSKATRVAFQKFGIKIWPGAGVVGDRKLIPEFTGKGIEDQGGFPVNSPDCMVLDQSVNNTWKTMRATCIPHFGSESPQGKQMGASSMTWKDVGKSQPRCHSECDRNSTKGHASDYQCGRRTNLIHE